MERWGKETHLCLWELGMHPRRDRIGRLHPQSLPLVFQVCPHCGPAQSSSMTDGVE